MSNFITNSEDTKTLKERVKKLISVSSELKFLVGFFYFSGWQELYNALKNNKLIILKILIGLQVDKYLSNIIEIGNTDKHLSRAEHFSHFMKSLGYAINNAEMDNQEFYEQVEFFIKLIEEDRIIIKKTLNPNHAKIYLFRLKDDYQDILSSEGEFITGSSNLTKAGLHQQEEFNVEIRDYGFCEAEKYFDDLWDKAIPITESINGKEVIIDFLKNKAQSSLITPYEAYAYILKTYIELQEAKKISSSLDRLFERAKFKKYPYQVDAVNQALNIIETYNGVIIADVVGLGKSVIASLIASQLEKRGLILCPPGLIGDKHQSTGWWEYINKFKLYDWDVESTGKVEELSQKFSENQRDYEVIIVDEAHRFRNQDTSAYEALANICRGKKVILLTATPFNNSPADIFSLLKLFLVPGKSGITIESDLESRFHAYNYRFKQLSFILKHYNSSNKGQKRIAEKKYRSLFNSEPPIDLLIVKNDIREMSNNIKNVISPIIIRRNRIDLKEDLEYKKDIQNLSKVNDPQEIFYELSTEQSQFYDKIINVYFSEQGIFTGAIYRPFEYEKKEKSNKNDETNKAIQQQRNLFDFMRRLLIKRFESSFGAFQRSIDRFLEIHKRVLSFIKKSGIYFLDRKIIEAIYNDDDEAEDFTYEAIEKAILTFEANVNKNNSPKHNKIYEINNFKNKDKFLKDIETDIQLFTSVKKEIIKLNLVDNDPKRKKIVDKVKEILGTSNLPKRKILIFTEYADTVNHLKNYFGEKLEGRVMCCAGNFSKLFLNELNENFNATNKKQKDDYDVLITTDKLSEGVNLNRAGLIINYDIPWNPTRVIQRLGRINRIGTKIFDELYIYNIFPSEQGADHVKIREIAEQKMFLIHNALGEDSKIFNPDEEPTASGLFNKINSNVIENEQLSIDTKIRNEYSLMKQKHPEIIEKISYFPNRIKTAKKFDSDNVIVLRKKGMALFSLFTVYKNGEIHIVEKNFEDLIDYVRCSYNEKRLKLSKRFWESYAKSKQFKPKYYSKSNSISLEQKATNSLKYLLKMKRNDIDQQLISFIDTLLLDIKQYKTIPKFTLRKLILPENITEESYINLINSIKTLKQSFGVDYLDKLLNKIGRIDDEIIISIENRSY